MKKTFLVLMLLTGIGYSQSLSDEVAKVDRSAARLGRVLDIRNQIDDQLLSLIDEMVKLHDPAVNKLILARWPKIMRLNTQLQQAGRQ